MQQENSLTRLGGTCAILMGVSYFLGGISYLFNPARQAINNYHYWEAVARDNRAEMVFHLTLTFVGLFGLAVVPSVAKLLEGKAGQWLTWINNLAYVCFSVSLVEHLRAIRVVPAWAEAFVANESYRPAIVSTHLSLELDPDHWLQFGGVGLWILVVSLLALRHGVWSKPLVWVGVATTVTYWLVVAGIAFRTGIFILVGGSVGGLILMPLWYIWIGQMLRKIP